MGKPPKPQPPQPPPITVLKRRSIVPVILKEGDNVTQEIVPGSVLQTAALTATQAMTANEFVLFETVFEGRRAIGGFILEEL